MLKVGIVGCGAISDAHAWAIQEVGGAEIVGACDAEALLAELFCERFHVQRAFTHVEEMLRQAQPDVVHVLTPPQTHYAIARQCLAQGCHVFVEKPFTLHAGEAEELLALANEQHRKLTVGHDAQFTHAARDMGRLVQNGYLGGLPVHLESYYGYEFGNLYGNALLGNKRHWIRRLPGKLLHNVISHGLARIAEFLPGDQPQVIAHGFVSRPLRQAGEEEIVDELRVIISDQGRMTAYFTFSSQMRPTLNQFRIFGPENGIVLDETQQSVIKLRGDRYKSFAERFVPLAGFSRQYAANLRRNLGRFLARDFHFESGKRHLIGSFYRAIAEGTRLPIPYRQILLTSRIMDRIFEQLGAQQAAGSMPAWSSRDVPGGESVIREPRSVASIAPNQTLDSRPGLIINADDWGRSQTETDAAWAGLQAGRVTTVSGMTFMADSERAAQIAREADLDVGLHFNLAEPYTGPGVSPKVDHQLRWVARLLGLTRYSLALYYPLLTPVIRDIYRAQYQEFVRLYGRAPSHIDGHIHRHLCSNVLHGEVLPRGAHVRRTFTFAPGEKGRLNLAYRRSIARRLAQRYQITDFFFSLHYCLVHHCVARVTEKAKVALVELMVHPKNAWELAYLKSADFAERLEGVRLLRFEANAPAPGAAMAVGHN